MKTEAVYPPRPPAGDWTDAAACKGAYGEFYPTQPSAGGVSTRVRQQTAAAKARCARCPVRQECLAHALATDELWGIWGGLTPQERARIPQQVAS